MLIQNKQTGAILFKLGDKKISFAAGTVIDVAEKTASALIKMYKGIVEVSKLAQASEPESKKENKSGGGNKNVPNPKRG